MSKWKKTGLWLLVGLLALFFTAGCKVTKKENPNKPVAKVNGEAITRGEFDRRYNQVKQLLAGMYGEEALKTDQGKQALDTLKWKILDEMIQDKVIEQRAATDGITVTDEEVNKQLEEAKKDANYEQNLKAQNITEEEYKKLIRLDLLKQKMKDQYTEKYKITEQDIENYYNSHMEEFGNLEQAKVRHILIAPEKPDDPESLKKAEQKANDLLRQLKAGADFVKLAKENSADPGSKDQGGELGYINPKTGFVTEFLDAVFKTNTPVGGFVIAKSKYGYHIIQIEDRKPSDVPPLSQIRKQVEEKATAAKKEEVFGGLVTAWVQNAKVEKFLK